MLEFLFKVTPADLIRGELELAAGASAALWGALAIAIAVGVVLGYARGAGAAARVRDRIVLWTLRAAALAIVFVALLDPHLRVKQVEPVSGGVAVLLDDSLSMRIAHDGRSRGERMLERFAPGEGTLARELDARFNTRYSRFALDSQPVRNAAELRFDGARSDVASALSALADRGGELAAVVLVTDGAGSDLRSNARSLDRALAALEASAVTLHVVGVGAATITPDVELGEFVVPDSVLRGDAVEATIAVEQHGYEERTVRVVIEDEGVVVAERTLEFGPEPGRSVVRVPLQFSDAGPRRLVARVDGFDGEPIAENNARSALVQVRRTPIEVLHVEGEPRFEVKFLRRAVGDDDGIRLRSLVRTAENKFYRLGVDDGNELAAGLPDDDAELFRYDAIVIGSVGNDLVDTAQQQRLSDFVARRGGGLIMLGGRHAFAEGGFAGTAIARLSPVVVPSEPAVFRRLVRIRPTSGGLSHPLLEVSARERLRETWTALPPLTMVNPIRRSKPGAVVLLNADDGSGEPLVGLAWHRYGRGTVAAFPVRDSWRWQMHADVPLDDLSHERLWRQLLRHVARPAGGRVRLTTSRGVAAVGDTVTVQAELLDAAYRPRVDAEPRLSVTTPAGEIVQLQMARTVDGAPSYKTELKVPLVGRYELALTVDGEDGDTAHRRVVEVAANGDEYHAARLDVAMLERLAARTGGRYFAIDDAAALVDAIDDTRSMHVSERRVRLNDMPALLVLLLALLAAEWAWRRRCRLP